MYKKFFEQFYDECRNTESLLVCSIPSREEIFNELKKYNVFQGTVLSQKDVTDLMAVATLIESVWRLVAIDSCSLLSYSGTGGKKEKLKQQLSNALDKHNAKTASVGEDDEGEYTEGDEEGKRFSNNRHIVYCDDFPARIEYECFEDYYFSRKAAMYNHIKDKYFKDDSIPDCIKDKCFEIEPTASGITISAISRQPLISIGYKEDSFISFSKINNSAKIGMLMMESLKYDALENSNSWDLHPDVVVENQSNLSIIFDNIYCYLKDEGLELCEEAEDDLFAQMLWKSQFLSWVKAFNNYQYFLQYTLNANIKNLIVAYATSIINNEDIKYRCRKLQYARFECTKDNDLLFEGTDMDLLLTDTNMPVKVFLEIIKKHQQP